MWRTLLRLPSFSTTDQPQVITLIQTGVNTYAYEDFKPHMSKGGPFVVFSPPTDYRLACV
jgi:hypothetical protein